MSERDGTCAEPNCDATYEPHHWGTKRAQNEGWFMQRDGTAWCPKHNPPWVAEWRASRT